MRDNVDARSCLRRANARWHRGSLPSYPADCLRVPIPSANAYGSPAASQCALQVSQCLRRCVCSPVRMKNTCPALPAAKTQWHHKYFILSACALVICLNQCSRGVEKLQYRQSFLYFILLSPCFRDNVKVNLEVLPLLGSKKHNSLHWKNMSCAL